MGFALLVGMGRDGPDEYAVRVVEAQEGIARANAEARGFEMAREMNQDDNEYELLRVGAEAAAYEMMQNGDSLRYLATYEQRTADNWRGFVQIVTITCAAAGVFGFALSYRSSGERCQGCRDRDRGAVTRPLGKAVPGWESSEEESLEFY